MTMITPSYLGETIEYSSLHACRSTLEDPTAASKVSLDAIARTTRHKSLSVLMGYVRPAQAFDDVALTTMIA